MSGLDRVHQFFIDRMAELLPSHRRLSNPYKPDENPFIILRQGYGLTIGAGSSNKRTISPILCVVRSFGVVLTREYLAREDDVDSKVYTEKLLIDDAASVSRDMEKNWTMDGLILRARAVRDSGIEYVTTETDRFLKTVIEFEVEYFEVTDDGC